MSTILFPSYRNLLEPPAFAQLFLRYPPLSFTCFQDSAGLPLFSTDFDLLTTLESTLRARLRAFPFFHIWSNWLKFSTCFIGTSITEYAPLPADITPQVLLDVLQRDHAHAHSLAIIKDVPEASPLLTEEEHYFAASLTADAVQRGFIEVQGQALAYIQVDFNDINAYMFRLSSSRRKDVRRKMKSRSLLEIKILPLGDTQFLQPNFLEELYSMYLAVFAQSEIHFDLLSPEFFAALLQNRDIEGVVICYWHKEILAGYNICLIHKDMLIDKYIGFKYPLARELNLYFISWLINLEFALQNGLKTYVAGWTDPEVKASLGAQFTFTRHLVWIKNPVLRRLLFPLRHFFESDKQVIQDQTSRCI